MLDPKCELRPWIFKVKFWKSSIPGMGWLMWVHRMSGSLFDIELWPYPWHWPYIFKVKCLKSWISGMGVSINMEYFLQMWVNKMLDLLCEIWGGWGCEVSCGGHHRPRGKTTTGSALDGAVFDIAQILAYLVHNMSRSQLYLGYGHFGWLPSFFGR